MSPGMKYQTNAPIHTQMKNLYLVTLHPFAVLFSDLCMVVNIAVDISTPGQIMLGGRTRYRRVRPANAYPRIWVEMVRSN